MVAKRAENAHSLALGAGARARGLAPGGGVLVAEGTPSELKAQTGAETMDDVFMALTGHPATPQAEEVA